MPFNVNEFKAKLDGQLLANPAFFRVLFTGAVVRSSEASLLAVLCNQAQLPGRSYSTNEYTTHGPIRKVPYQNIYDDVVLSIYCREDMGTINIFQEWQNYIVDSSAANEFSYFDDYTSDIIIEQYNSQGQVKYACKLIDAYPVMVAPIQLDWGNKDSFTNLQITMAYRYWRQEPLDLNPFGSFLSVNSLYPNFDISGALEKTGVALFSRADGQFMSSVGQQMSFASNVGRKKLNVTGSDGGNIGTLTDNYMVNAVKDFI